MITVINWIWSCILALLASFFILAYFKIPVSATRDGITYRCEVVDHG